MTRTTDAAGGRLIRALFDATEPFIEASAVSELPTGIRVQASVPIVVEVYVGGRTFRATGHGDVGAALARAASEFVETALNRLPVARRRTTARTLAKGGVLAVHLDPAFFSVSLYLAVDGRADQLLATLMSGDVH